MDWRNVRVRGRLCILLCSKDALYYLKPSTFRSFTRASRRLAPSSDSENKQHVWRINPASLSGDCQTTPPQWWTGWMFTVYLPPGCAAVSNWTVPGADNTRKEHRAISLCRRGARSAQTPRPPSLASEELQEKAWYIGMSFPQLSKSMLTRTSPRAAHFLSCFCTRLVTRQWSLPHHSLIFCSLKFTSWFSDQNESDCSITPNCSPTVPQQKDKKQPKAARVTAVGSRCFIFTQLKTNTNVDLL